jgi:hypothetical protein
LADRDTKDDEFGEPLELSSSRIVGTSPDGLRLVTLSLDRGSLLEIVRADKQTDFGEPTDGSFATLNAHAFDNDLWFEGALVSPGDNILVYTVLADEGDSFPVHISTRDGVEAWPVGEPIDNCELKAYGALQRRATGISADGLTLFFYDPVSEQSRAGWRSSLEAPFDWFADLGSGYSMQPNLDCSRVYFTSLDAMLGVSVADVEQ